MVQDSNENREDNDQSALQRFLDDVEQVLGALVESRDRLMPESLRDDALAAWQEGRETFSTVRSAVQTVAREDLARAGLVGSQLRLKLRGFGERLRQFGEGFFDFLRDRLPLDVIKRIIKKLLEWANIILGSLASIIPPAEALQELKDGIKLAVDDFSPA
jgi:hypothetical protein